MRKNIIISAVLVLFVGMTSCSGWLDVKPKKTVEEEQITYILFEEGMKFEEKECREDVIADTYPLVYQSDDGRIRIYGTKE